ncbi:PcsB-like coiled-coil domain-containing protein [Paucisalibacillus globulus]|uniref:PcsB-like coiled-coil domain-containing protein n=1 Tax=Paucisalibacillus globulus TaxID=351095 RepID=UPI00041E8176|nr:3D domain-containing protein [Paucisalibacillus globulus]
MRRLTVITLAISIIFGTAFSSIHVFAAEKDELQDIKDQRNQIQKNLSGAQLQIDTIMSEIDELNNEISRVNEEISKNQTLIDQTEGKITNTIVEIGKLQEEIRELEADIEKRQEILKERMSSYQKSGGSINYLEVLFGAQSFSDFISRITAVNTITQSDADLIENLESDIKAVEEKKLLSLNKLDELNEMKLEQEETLAIVQQQKQQNEASRNTLEAKQSELLSIIEKLKKEDSSLASVESDIKNQIAAEEARKKKEKELELLANKSSDSNDSSQSKETIKNVDGKTLTVTATAYTAYCKGCTGITHTGINLKDNPDSKVIAVDPSVIPLGSVVYVEGYGYAIAGDTGTAIKGNKIDVFVPSRAEALKWGVRKVKVTIQ